jgi:hypothetical protein
MAISEKTKTILTRSLIYDADDLYPDRAATPTSPGVFPIRDTGATSNRFGDEVPTTTKDMNKLFEWEHGDVLYGKQAKDHVGMKRYREDIDKAYGKQDKYKDKYIDIYTGRIPVSKQLEEFD